MKKNMFDRIRQLEAALITFTEEGIRDIPEAIQLIEDLRDRQKGPRRA